MAVNEAIMSCDLRWREVGRVLLIHPGGLGDLLMAAPALWPLPVMPRGFPAARHGSQVH